MEDYLKLDVACEIGNIKRSIKEHKYYLPGQKHLHKRSISKENFKNMHKKSNAKKNENNIVFKTVNEYYNIDEDAII